MCEFESRARLRERIAELVAAGERRLYRREAHLSANFRRDRRWEDVLNAVTAAHRQAPIYVENWYDTTSRPRDFLFRVENLITPAVLEMAQSLAAGNKRKDANEVVRPCQCAASGAGSGQCGRSARCCPANFFTRHLYCGAAGNRLRNNYAPSREWLVECSKECACGLDCPTKVVQVSVVYEFLSGDA